MSSRELRALLADKPKNSSVAGRTRSLASHGSEPDMGETERIAELESALEEARQKLKEQRDELEEAKVNEGELSERLKALEIELENSMLRAEVEKLRTVEKAREEERDRSQKWVDDLREGFRAKKMSLEEKIARLEAGTASMATPAPTGGVTSS